MLGICAGFRLLWSKVGRGSAKQLGTAALLSIGEAAGTAALLSIVQSPSRLLNAARLNVADTPV